MLSANDIRWNDLGRQASQILSRYIRIDSSNPPGSESETARFLSDLLSAEDIDATVYEAAPGRSNLVARLKGGKGAETPGNGDQGALLLLHHMDVVPAPLGPPESRLEAWTVPPFSGAMRDGYVWGRGAIDDKGLGIAHLMAFILLKRLGITPKRDIVLMAVADEEEGGKYGARWMIEHHWQEIACEYVWDEGGAGTMGVISDRPVFGISVTEKRSITVRLTATGRGGHGAMVTDTAIDRLTSALHALRHDRGDVKFNQVTREFFRRIAETQPFPVSWFLRHADHPAIKPLLVRKLPKAPGVQAMLRDTLTTTVLMAGQKANMAPQAAVATLDLRLLPDTDLEEYLANLKRTVNDKSILIEVAEPPASPSPSPTDSPMFRAFERVIDLHVPGAVVTPMQTPVATDSRFFRARGVKAYGLVPAILTQEELSAVHGVNERLSVENLTLSIRIALDVILDLCART